MKSWAFYEADHGEVQFFDAPMRQSGQQPSAGVPCFVTVPAMSLFASLCFLFFF